MKRQPVSFLTQSRFYSPVFNSAIFDGPFRIYFSQHQEGVALKVYFKLQEKLKDFYQSTKSDFKNHGRNVFIMLYPTRDYFEAAFATDDDEIFVVMDRLGEDPVIGIRGAAADADFDGVFAEIAAVIQTLEAPRPTMMERPAEAF